MLGSRPVANLDKIGHALNRLARHWLTSSLPDRIEHDEQDLALGLLIIGVGRPEL
jgi:hypothetical protein